MAKDEKDQKDDLDRRKLIRLSATSASLLVGAAAMGGVVVRMPMPLLLPGPPRRVRVGRLSAFPAGVERLFSDQRLLVRRDKEGISAMSTECTHLGCAVTRAREGFDCPCHGSKFSSDGAVLAGPAPRGLPWYRVEVVRGQDVIVDLDDEVDIGTRTKTS